MFPNLFLISLAVVALLCVVFEEKIHINKAKTTLFCGTLAWVILFVAAGKNGSKEVDAALSENLMEIASLWLFLISAMTFVVYLNRKGMIVNLIYRLLPGRLTERKLMLLTGLFCFCFSSICDNITATLCSITLILSLRLSPEKNVRYAVLVVFAINSGGVSLITGDVTTLMIFLADRVEIQNLLLLGISSFVGVLVLALLLSRELEAVVELNHDYSPTTFVDRVIAVIFLCTIAGSLAASVFFSIPPVLCFLFGLSLMFLAASIFQEKLDDDPIMNYIRLIEFDTLLFFLGVLLVVGMLEEIHVLESVALLYTGLPPSLASLVMGLLSAMIDNVPLTAGLLKSGIELSLTDWLLVTYAVGVGGSLLVIGSAAGIVAMSKVSGLTFSVYLRFLWQLLIAYGCGFVATLLLGRAVFGGW